MKVTSSLSTLGRLIMYRLTSNRDIKVVIVGKSGATGIGKSTLAVRLCRQYDRNGWELEKAFLDVNAYIHHYKEKTSEGDMLLMDEIEVGADSRRAMAQENVDLSHAFATLRFKNVGSVLTLPTTAMLDKRITTLADVLVICQPNGRAHPYYLWTNDFTQQTSWIRLTNDWGHEETMLFDPLDGDPEFEELSRMKEEFVVNGMTGSTFDQEDVDQARDEATQDLRADVAVMLSEKTDLNQHTIGTVLDRSQQWVSKTVNA